MTVFISCMHFVNWHHDCHCYRLLSIMLIKRLIRAFGDMDWIKQAKDKVKWWTTVI